MARKRRRTRRKATRTTNPLVMVDRAITGTVRAVTRPLKRLF